MQKTCLAVVWLATLLSVALVGCSSSDKDAASSGGAGGGAGAAGAKSPSAAYVGPEFFLAIVAQPQRIASSPLVAPLLKMDMVAEKLKELGIDPAQMEQLTLLMSAPADDSRFGEPGPPCFIVRFAQSVEPKQLLTKFQSGVRPGIAELAEVDCAGKKCWQLSFGVDRVLAHAPNNRTIVMAAEREMPKLLAAPEGKGPLADRLRKTSLDGDVLLAMEMLPTLRQGIEKGLAADRRHAPPEVAPFLDIPLLLQGGTVALDLSGSNLLTANVEAKDAGDAAKLESLVKQALDKGKQQLDGLRSQVPAPFQQALSLADEALQGITLAKSSNVVRATMKRPASMNDAVAQLSTMLVASAGTARGAAQRSQSSNNLKQIALGLQNHHDVFRSLPAQAICDKAGKPLLSWRVKILPFIEQRNLYEQFKLDEPWDSAHNKALISQMPASYRKPGGSAGPGKTVYLGAAGEGMLFGGTKARSIAEITDGTSNTIAVLEVDDAQAVIWTKPDDFNPPSDQPLAGLGNAQPGGFHAGFVDGSVQFLIKTIDARQFRALLTIAGAEPVSRF